MRHDRGNRRCGIDRPRSFGARLSAVLLPLAGIFACSNYAQRQNVIATGGDPDQGPAAIAHYACSACHTIPGISGPDVLVGPPLDRLSRQVFIAGVLTNTPENLIRWIQHPTQVDSLTAMPDLGVTTKDARDIAAYLYSR